MGRGVCWTALVLTSGVVLGCTSGQVSEPEATAPGRHLAGEPLSPCTIKGEYPVAAEADALCGVLTVPEDRSEPDGRRIGLRVAVVPAAARSPEPDPLFVLAGGPGEAATQFFAWFPAVFEDVHADRDLVLVDQRGTGASHARTLPEVPETAGMSAAAADARLSTWARDALDTVDADPRFYTSTVAAEDLDDVRTALGYGRIDLYGTSYGGTLLQYYLRQYPENVRAAVLDGSTPLDVPVLERIAASTQSALDLLFQRCAADPACAATFPRLAAEWSVLQDRLASPLRIVDPTSGEEAVVDMVDLADAVHAALLTEATAVQIPLAVHLAYDYEWVKAAQLISAPPSGGPTLLMADVIACSEAWARLDPSAVARHGEGSYALTRELADAEARAARCSYLPRGVVPPDDDAPVRTDKPMLWLVGDGDPQDPPANLTEVPAQQPNSRIVVVPAQQHVVGHLGCAPTLVAEFLDAGDADRLDPSCATSRASTPPFRLE